MGSPFRAAANAVLTFERTEVTTIRRSLEDSKFSVDATSYFGDCSDAEEDANTWGSLIMDSRMTGPLLEPQEVVIETLEVTVSLRRDKAAQTDQTPRSYNIQLGPNTDLIPLKGICIEPKLLPSWIRPYSRARCRVTAQVSDVSQDGIFVVGWMIQSPWKPVQKALGSRFAGNLLLTGPGNPVSPA